MWNQAVEVGASNMKAEIVKRVREKVTALNNQRNALSGADKHKFDEAIIAVHSLATELEAIDFGSEGNKDGNPH